MKKWIPLLAFAAVLPGLAAADTLSVATSRFATLDGAKVHYKSVGEGKKAVVFVHGFACDLTIWRLQAPALEGKTRAIYLDLPGFGKSDKPDLSYTTVYFAKAVDAVLVDAGVEEAVLVGHSMGVPIVRETQRLDPKRVKALVAVDGALRSLGLKKEQAAAFVGLYESPSYQATIGAMVDSMFTKDTPPALREEVKATMQAVKQSVAVSAMRGMTDEEAFRGNDPIPVPLLVLNARSPYWTADYEAHVKKIAPGVDYQVLEGAGHFVMLDKAETFNTLLTAFVAKQSAAPRPAANPKDVASVDAILAA
ncbi:MAG: alpha/beta hydrolase, partial [Acidobacteria bacterium]|nr:alpha/beta hydrolase [Acidobacteriota bacterium]